MEFPVEIEIKVPDGTPESEVEARESAEATAAGQHRSQPATRVANGGTIDPALQVVVTVPLGVALGAGFDRYLHHPADPLWWGVVLLYGGVCVASVLLGARRTGKT